MSTKISLIQIFRKVCSYLHRCSSFLLDRIAVVGATHGNLDAVILVRADSIGDFVLWLDSARILRDHFHNRRIILVASQAVAGLASQVGYFDQVIGVDLQAFEKDLIYRSKLVRRLRSIGAGIAIQPTYSRTFWIGDAMIRATGATERIGSSSDLCNIRPWQRRISDAWYTRLIPASDGLLMEFERNGEFLRGLGVTNVRPAVAKIGAVAELPPLLRIESEYFIVFPGAASSKRMWPAESFGASARAIAEQYGWRMVVCGSAAEADTARRVINHAGLTEYLDYSGKTSLPEFVELVRGARLLITNETSAVHIAATVETPSVCLLGGGHFERFLPYPSSVEGLKPIVVFRRMQCFGCRWHCTLPHREGGPVPCIDAIQVQDVVNAVQECIFKSVINTNANV